MALQCPRSQLAAQLPFNAALRASRAALMTSPLVKIPTRRPSSSTTGSLRTCTTHLFITMTRCTCDHQTRPSGREHTCSLRQLQLNTCVSAVSHGFHIHVALLPAAEACAQLTVQAFSVPIVTLGEVHCVVCRNTLVSSSKRAAEVMSVVRLTTTGDSVMTSATLYAAQLLLTVHLQCASSQTVGCEAHKRAF